MLPPSILIQNNISSLLTAFLSENKYTKLAVLVDENTRQFCYPLIQQLLPVHQLIEIKSGEEEKHLGTCQQVWQHLTDFTFDRKALVLNLGGGVIGDMGGFCAATYKRGIDFVQMPTTLLSMVDASVGGKLGVDFNGFKNHIGVFQEPKRVFIDSRFLATLPAAELRSGFAEIVKHCLIADDAKWNEIKGRPLADFDWNEMIAHSVAIKAKVVTEDPQEKGLRKILNFGHTIGHAVETWFLAIPGKRLLHGEAIAIGMIAEAWISKERGFISEADLKEIVDYLLQIYGKVQISSDDLKGLLPYTLQDKKNENDQVQCALLAKVGQANFSQIVNASEIIEALGYYNSL